MQQQLTTAFFLLLGLWLGLKIPDSDQYLPFLVHRSLITHGLFVSLGFMLLASSLQDERLRQLTIGVCLATALHLCFDLFPRGWVGFALIHIPGYGRTEPWFSWLWIWSSIVVSLYGAFYWIRHKAHEIILTLTSLVATFAWLVIQEAFWIGALTTLIISTLMVLWFPSEPQLALKNLHKRWLAYKNMPRL